MKNFILGWSLTIFENHVVVSGTVREAILEIPRNLHIEKCIKNKTHKQGLESIERGVHTTIIYINNEHFKNTLKIYMHALYKRKPITHDMPHIL